MKTFLMVLILSVAVAGCRHQALVKREEAFPSDFNKLPLLSDEAAFPPKYLSGVRAAQKVLLSENENPAEFRTWVREVNSGKIWCFSVVHLTSLEERYRHTLGNPSGKDRAILFDTATGEVLSSLLTQ